MLITKESNGTVTLDGSGTLLLTHNDYCIKVVGEPKVNIHHFNIHGPINKNRQLVHASKFIYGVKKAAFYRNLIINSLFFLVLWFIITLPLVILAILDVFKK